MSLTQRFLNIVTDAASSLRAVDTPVSDGLRLLQVMQPRSRKEFHCMCCKLLILFPMTERTQISSEQAEHQKAAKAQSGPAASDSLRRKVRLFPEPPSRKGSWWSKVLLVTGSQQASPVYLAKKTQLQALHFTLIKCIQVRDA